MSTGEYRGKIIIEADGSEVQQATKQVNNMAAAFTGANAVFRGTSEVVRGNYQGFLELAVGARLLWTALGAVSPVLKIATIALSAIGPVIGGVISYFRDSKPIDNYTERIKKLGLAISDLERHKQAVKSVAAEFHRIEEAAKAAQGAIEKVADAQLALNRAKGDSKLAQLDLEEATRLAGATTDEERRSIQREYVTRRADLQTDNIQSDFELRRKNNAQAREAIQGEWQQDEQKRSMLQGNIGSAQQLVSDTLKRTLATIVASEDFSSVPMRDQWRAKMVREKEITSEFDADPKKALRKYSSRISDENLKSLSDQISNVDLQKRILADFDAEAPARASDRSGRYHAKVADEDALAAERDAALLRVQTGKVNVLAGLDSQERAASAAAAAHDSINTEKGNATELQRLEDERNASATEGRYRFDKADPQRQMAYLDHVLKNMEGKDLTPQQREDRIGYMRMRDDVQKRIDSETRTMAGRKASESQNQAARDAQIAEARQGLRSMAVGPSHSIDTSALFEAYYAGGVNKTDDAQQLIADRAREQVFYLKTIAAMMKGSQE